jgi:hypothetical protein
MLTNVHFEQFPDKHLTFFVHQQDENYATGLSINYTNKEEK